MMPLCTTATRSVAMRMGVALGRHAVRRPARVADADRAGQRLAAEPRLEVAELALGAAALDVAVRPGWRRRPNRSRDIPGAAAPRPAAARPARLPMIPMMPHMQTISPSLPLGALRGLQLRTSGAARPFLSTCRARREGQRVGRHVRGDRRCRPRRWRRRRPSPARPARVLEPMKAPAPIVVRHLLKPS